ncbi:uncharacterized protein LOC113464329 [Ceratina calcarata]|uniref:Uncharacterized protein LOC113464329 n=1 Tax=Ceratina calcarata TaxID=156304 RepID=A0AAJ7WAR0_9HYME|nr:uncharacterized protein LOC113464329 [Ceratina calcarata]
MVMNDGYPGVGSVERNEKKKTGIKKMERVRDADYKWWRCRREALGRGTGLTSVTYAEKRKNAMASPNDTISDFREGSQILKTLENRFSLLQPYYLLREVWEGRSKEQMARNGY